MLNVVTRLHYLYFLHAVLTKMSGMKAVLKNFIINRVLSDSETLQKYTKGRCSIPSGSFEKKYREEMRILILTRLLVLVIFLDKAKMANALDRVPCLFIKESKLKSTSDVLIKFCRECLYAEGNIIKHLTRLGISVSYKQEPIDELDFTVSNLAADIRDGVRLTRVAEILTNATPKSLLTKLRLPAVSRLQKLHNVGVVLSLFDEIGVHNTLDIAAHHIVDGYREQVLQLLWMIAAKCGIFNVLNCKTLEEEIEKVKLSKRNYARRWSLRETNEIHMPQTLCGNELCSLDEKVKALLIFWCSAVTSKFGIHVYDFTHSFNDGVVLCLLIHYYHPGLLSLDDIKATSRHGMSGEEAIKNENHNFSLALDRMSEIGGIPRFLNSGKSKSNTEEKSIFLCLVYLCARLMESSSEIHACLLIQKWYRKKREMELTKMKICASKKIWRIWNIYRENYYAAQRKKFGRSVEVIECFALSIKDKLRQVRNKRILKECLEKCAILIQAHVRGYQTREQFIILQKLAFAACTIQRCWRCINFKVNLKKSIQERRSATIIQAAWRQRLCKLSLSRALNCLVKFQARSRGFLARTHMKRSHHAATRIQRVWRGFICQILYQIDVFDILTVQSIARRLIAVRKYTILLEAALVLQCFIRKVHAKREHSRLKAKTDLLMTRHKAAEKIQAMMRDIVTRRKEFKNAMIVKIQSFVRLHLKRRDMRNRKIKIIKIQSVVRRLLSRSKFMMKTSSILKVQSYWRRRLEERNYAQILYAIVSLQSFIRLKFVAKQCAIEKKACIHIQRAFRSQRRYRISKKAKVLIELLIQAQNETTAAIQIQSVIRSFQCRQQVFSQRYYRNDAAKIIQTKWRGVSAVKKFHSLIKSATLIQRLLRGFLIKRKNMQQARAVILIQKNWRRFDFVKHFWLAKNNILKLQSAIRGMLVRQRCHTKRESILQIQRFVRNQLATKRLARMLNEEKVEHAAIIIQSHTRQTIARSKFLRAQLGALKIQSMWRMYKKKTYYGIALFSIIQAQSSIRRFLAKKCLSTKYLAALKVQSFARIAMAKLCLKNLREEKIKFTVLSCCAVVVQVSRI